MFDRIQRNLRINIYYFYFKVINIKSGSFSMIYSFMLVNISIFFLLPRLVYTYCMITSEWFRFFLPPPHISTDVITSNKILLRKITWVWDAEKNHCFALMRFCGFIFHWIYIFVIEYACKEKFSENTLNNIEIKTIVGFNHLFRFIAMIG